MVRNERSKKRNASATDDDQAGLWKFNRLSVGKLKVYDFITM